MDVLNILAIAVNIIIGILVFGSVLDDIHQQTKTQKKVDSLYENLKSHQDTCNAINHKLSEIANDQSTFNETVTHNLEIQWSAIHIIVNQIKERE